MVLMLGGFGLVSGAAAATRAPAFGRPFTGIARETYVLDVCLYFMGDAYERALIGGAVGFVVLCGVVVWYCWQ